MRRLQRIKETSKAVKKKGVRVDFSKLTEDEKNALAQEISERLKDIVTIKTEQHAYEFVEKLTKVSVYSGDDTINFNYRTIMNYNDILQILGRVRRP